MRKYVTTSPRHGIAFTLHHYQGHQRPPLMIRCLIWSPYLAPHLRYYIMQLIKVSPQLFFIFKKWGSTGSGAYGSLDVNTKEFTNKAAAIKFFDHHFKDKTGNKFEDVHNFKKRPGKYNFVVSTSYDDSQLLKLNSSRNILTRYLLSLLANRINTRRRKMNPTRMQGVQLLQAAIFVDPRCCPSKCRTWCDASSTPRRSSARWRFVSTARTRMFMVTCARSNRQIRPYAHPHGGSLFASP